MGFIVCMNHSIFIIKLLKYDTYLLNSIFVDQAHRYTYPIDLCIYICRYASAYNMVQENCQENRKYIFPNTHVICLYMYIHTYIHTKSKHTNPTVDIVNTKCFTIVLELGLLVKVVCLDFRVVVMYVSQLEVLQQMLGSVCYRSDISVWAIERLRRVVACCRNSHMR